LSLQEERYRWHLYSLCYYLVSMNIWTNELQNLTKPRDIVVVYYLALKSEDPAASNILLGCQSKLKIENN
jgi:hypothetical protein